MYVDFFVEDRNRKWKQEYTNKAKTIGKHVLLINSIRDEIGYANGGAIYFKNGEINQELDMNKKGVLMVNL